MPLSRLHVPDIAAEVLARGIAADISGTTIWRWLSEDAIRPWRSRSWIFPRAANFEAKAGRVLDLYARTWEGKDVPGGRSSAAARRPPESSRSADSSNG